MADHIDNAVKDTEFLTEKAIEYQLTGGHKEAPAYRGTVRICLRCQRPIPEKRLIAEPKAVRCTPCQAVVDEEEKAKKERL